MVHAYDGRYPFGGAQPENRNVGGCSHGVTVERDNVERVTRKGEAANLAGARVEDVKQHPLSLFYANRFAMAEHAAVDRKQSYPNLEPLVFSLASASAFLPIS